MTTPDPDHGAVDALVKDDAGKLVLLAEWFDIHDAKAAANGYPSSGDEVQQDLRRIAQRLVSEAADRRALIDRLRAVEAALEQTVYMLDWTGDMAMHLPAGYDETRLTALELLFPGSADKAAALRERVAARAALRSRP